MKLSDLIGVLLIVEVARLYLRVRILEEQITVVRREMTIYQIAQAREQALAVSIQNSRTENTGAGGMALGAAIAAGANAAAVGRDVEGGIEKT